MAQGEQEAASPTDHGVNFQNLWRRLFRRDSGSSSGPSAASSRQGSPKKEDEPKDPRDPKASGLMRRVSRKVVPGLPRAQTFKRQQSELRNNLEPVQPTPAERRAVSVDRRMQAASQNGSLSLIPSNPRTSAPDFINHSFSAAPSVPSLPSVASLPIDPVEEKVFDHLLDTVDPTEEDPSQEDPPEDVADAPMGEYIEDLPPHVPDSVSLVDTLSMTNSQYDAMIHDELERTWILNLSMHFRDKSKREKFFVTYREQDTLWRRVTVSLDYRNAPENSLEAELAETKFQREKNAEIYKAIRESLRDIQFYDTVTNLKLQTTENRLHVHVVEDVNEIVHYPSVRAIQHMRCSRIKERDIRFDSHMSGFVYKVRVNGEVLIKKEIPGPDSVDEFLYEINALNQLKHSTSVIKFYGVIVDDRQEYVKGLLISFAEQGALIDIIYDNERGLPWPTRERWARQIVQGLSEIHEAGFVQGDFTLSNIVIDGNGDAKIIDINRRGCPVGWEPPEATPLIENNQRISMYIGVKSDLFQLGMVLWALATQDDEPEVQGRPLRIGPDLQVPIWYRKIVDICLSDDPRRRLQALQLLAMMPEPEMHDPTRHDPQYSHPSLPSISVDDDISGHEYLVDGYHSPGYRSWGSPVHPANDWSYVGWGHSPVSPTAGIPDDPYFYPTRGRSPPSPLPSSHGGCRESRYGQRWPASYENSQAAPSVYDSVPDESREGGRSTTPRTSRESMPAREALVGDKMFGGLGLVNGVDALRADDDGVEEAALEIPTDDVVVNGVAEPESEEAGTSPTKHSASTNTPVQQPGQPADDVATEVRLPGASDEAAGDQNKAAPVSGLSESGKTEPGEHEQQQQEKQSGDEPLLLQSHGNHLDLDGTSPLPTQTQPEITEGKEEDPTATTLEESQNNPTESSALQGHGKEPALEDQEHIELLDPVREHIELPVLVGEEHTEAPGPILENHIQVPVPKKNNTPLVPQDKTTYPTVGEHTEHLGPENHVEVPTPGKDVESSFPVPEDKTTTPLVIKQHTESLPPKETIELPGSGKDTEPASVDTVEPPALGNPEEPVKEETAANMRNDNETHDVPSNEIVDLVASLISSPADILSQVAAAPPLNEDSKMFSLHDGMPDDLKGVGTGWDRAIDWQQQQQQHQHLVTEDDFRILQGQDTTINNTMTNAITTTTDDTMTRQQS